MAVEKARVSAEGQTIAWVFPAAARLRLAQGDAPGVRSLLKELERTPNVRYSTKYLTDLPDAVRTALGAGDADLAARLTLDLEPLHPLHQHCLTATTALLAEHRGQYADAAEAFARAAWRWELFETPWELAHALLGKGRCLLALGRPSEATAPIHDAGRVFLSLGAKPALVEVDALLAQATARTS
jgi:hypothetical protein